jgi:hypothetical protein
MGPINPPAARPPPQVEPPLADVPAVRTVADELMGAGRYRAGLRPVEEYDNVIVRWPTETETRPLALWQRPASGHLESYNGAKAGVRPLPPLPFPPSLPPPPLVPALHPRCAESRY